MAQLPGGRYLIQEIDGLVRLFERHTEKEILMFDPGNANAVAVTQKSIHDCEELNPEEKSFAHFWCGYFYANATIYQILDVDANPAPPERTAILIEDEKNK